MEFHPLEARHLAAEQAEEAIGSRALDSTSVCNSLTAPESHAVQADKAGAAARKERDLAVRTYLQERRDQSARPAGSGAGKHRDEIQAAGSISDRQVEHRRELRSPSDSTAQASPSKGTLLESDRVGAEAGVRPAVLQGRSFRWFQ